MSIKKSLLKGAVFDTKNWSLNSDKLDLDGSILSIYQ